MINEPAISQVACAALQIATVDLLSSWNIQPSRVVGHSSGEIAAAYCAGKLGRQAAWRIAYFRGIISSIKYPTKGAMLAVGASQHDLAPYMDQINHTLPGELIVACYNSPINNTVSGNEPKVDALKALLDASGIFARKLTVANAYHSSHMRAAANVYFILLGDLKSDDKIKTPGEITMFSSVTGQIVSLDDLESAQHWVDNLVSPVNFSKTLAAACFQNVKKGQKPVSINNTAENIFLHDILEVGPHGALQSAIKQTISAHTNATPIEYMSILNRNSPGLGTVLMVPATLKSRGYNVDLNGPNVTTSSYCPQLLVNLPPYVLNHTSKIWFESRLTRNFRLREHPIHDLFGAPVDDWNADEPRWRNVIRVLENPRLKEHIMTGSYIYPGVGYIVMATEAAKQLSGPNLALSGFLRDISIKAALHVPDTRDGVEVMVYMSRMDESSTERSKVWSDFKIMSWNSAENDWIEHCTGYISVETDPKANFIGNGFEVQQESIILQQKLENAVQRCQYPLDITRFYENMSDKGLVFGPLFRNLSDVKMSKGLGEATGVVTIPDVAEAMPKNFMHPHVIHPCTLDSMLHLSMMSILDSLNTDFLPVAMLPTFMREVWVSAATDTNPGHKFCGHGKSTLVASQKYETDITVWDADLNQPRVMIKGLKAAPVSNTDTADSRVSGLCHALEWKPDVTLYKSNKMPNVVQMSQDEINYRRQEVEDLQLATMLLIMDALDQLEGLIVESLEGHFQKYYNWLKLMANVLKSDDMIHLPFARWLEHKDDEKFKTRLYKKVARRSAEGELRIRAGSNIVQVLKKEVDPLHLLFGLDDLLDNVYAGSMEAGNISGLVRACMDLIAHCHTDLKILEIGAGTGSLTAVLLETLSPIPTNEHSSAKGSRIAKYDFTDVSASFFEKSKERFKAWRNILNFFPLNIENDPQEQGFTLGEYDLIVAGNVLHATKDLQKTLGNVRRLLKPDGKLIIQEGVRQDFLFVPVAFGFLEGWWLSVEDVRRWCPFVSQEEWAKALQATGFSDIEISLRDWDDAELNGISAFVASAVDTESYEDSIPRDILVLTAGSAQGIFAASLKAKLSEKYSSLNYEIAELSDLDRVELSDVHLPDRAATTGDPTADPHLNMIAGLMRTVRWERDLENSNLVSFGVMNPRPPQDSILHAIVDIVDHQYAKAHERKSNAEYRLHDNMILTNRLVNATEMNDYLVSKSSKPKAQFMNLGEAEAQRPLRLTTEAPGMLNKLQFETDWAYSEPLGGD
ncbi:hypothetical protein FQN49_002640 [Arthroderma sp. PD_2]|nr:hypothetical protein FQN49_002640 [Arthroderma sp. PD_2]